MQIAAFLVFGFLFGFIGSRMAASRQRNVAVWAVICFLFPLIGLIVLLVIGQAAPDTNPKTSKGKWNTLLEVDADIRQAAETARARGPAYEAMLSQKYLQLNDKSYLPGILTSVLKQADLDSTEPEEGTFGEWKYEGKKGGSYKVIEGRFKGMVFESHSEMMTELAKFM